MLVTEKVAQAVHDQRREADLTHDAIRCWCCCLDCDFNVDRVRAWDREMRSVSDADPGFPDLTGVQADRIIPELTAAGYDVEALVARIVASSDGGTQKR